MFMAYAAINCNSNNDKKGVVENEIILNRFNRKGYNHLHVFFRTSIVIFEKRESLKVLEPINKFIQNSKIFDIILNNCSVI